MYGKNRNERNSQDRFSNRERYGQDRDDALERDLHRDSSEGRSSGQRFASDDRTYSMNDRNFEPASGRNTWRSEDRDEDSYIGSRGYNGYEDYPGTRDGRKDFGASSRGGSRGSSAGDYRSSSSHRGEASNDSRSRQSFMGQPGLSGANANGRYSSPTSQGYRSYQDYGPSSTNERGWSGTDDGGSSGYGATQGSVGSSYDSSYDRRHAGKGPKGYKRSDEKIHDEVCELLTSHYDIDASEIEVEVKDGVVTLGGAVESRRTKRMAEDVVADMNGVQDVRNNLRILSHDSRVLESNSDGKSSAYRSPNSSTDSTLAPKSGKSASSSSNSTTNRQ